MSKFITLDDRSKIKKEKEEKLQQMLKGKYNWEIFEQIKSLHTHAELCKNDEMIYREEDVEIIVKVISNKFYQDGFSKGMKE